MNVKTSRLRPEFARIRQALKIQRIKDRTDYLSEYNIDCERMALPKGELGQVVETEKYIKVQISQGIGAQHVCMTALIHL